MRTLLRTSSQTSPSAELPEGIGEGERGAAGARRRAGSAELCPRCGGAGFLAADVPVEHPDFGKAIPCACKQKERLERRLQSMASVSGHDAIQHLDFDSFHTDLVGLDSKRIDNLQSAVRIARTFAADPDGWLLITGTFGCGKTHLAAAIANARIAAGQPALFVIVADLLDHLRSAYQPDSELPYDTLFETLREAPLLVLDDLGAHSATSWAQEKLFQLLNHRYNLRLPTVITTNQRVDEMDQRIASRLQDYGLVKQLPILAPDYRVDRSNAREELSSLPLYGNKRFDTFVDNRSELDADARLHLKQVVTQCRRFAQKPDGWLLLQGVNGCGKTHLAAAIANEIVSEARTEVMFVSTANLLDHLRGAFNPQSPVSLDRRFDEVKKVPVLVLDNLGTESATPWAREKLIQLLEYRYDARLPTVITTSRPLDKIDEWLKARIYDDERFSVALITAKAWAGSRSRPQQTTPRGRR